MSIIRLSAIGMTLYAPREDGTFVEQNFSSRTLVGVLGDFERPPDDKFQPFLDKHRKQIDRYLPPALEVARSSLPTVFDPAHHAPVCVLVHGFLFDPQKAIRRDRKDNDNPHGRVYHFDWCKRDDDEVDFAALEEETKEHTTGWPKALGFRMDDQGANGVAVAFGWYSNPGLAKSLLQSFENFYSRAYDYGRDTAWPFICTLDSLARALPDWPIDIFCHSLGAVLIVRGLAIAAKLGLDVVQRIGRVVILGGSEYTGEANVLYRRLIEYANRKSLGDDVGPQVYNIVSRENFVLDLLAENFGPKSFFSDTQVIGHDGLASSLKAPRWIDLQIDSASLREWLKQRSGFDISGDDPASVWDHWYYYTWPGNMDLYRAILRNRSLWSQASLRSPEDGGSPVPESTQH